MHVRFLQWNIWRNEHPINILSILQALRPDICCLQEVTENGPKSPGIHAAKLLAEALNMEFHFTVASTRPAVTAGFTEKEGVAILSKFPIESVRQAVIKPENDPSNPYDQSARVYAEAVCIVNGNPLTIGTCHMSFANKGFSDDRVKNQETNQLMEIIGHQPKRYVLAVGNHTPG
jgi:endonuclease/exonuclease/phosphatase family metal-dependent hydrolase